MKPFSVNKNSWHYRLNIRMCKTNERLYEDVALAERFVCSKDTICSYWRLTAWSVFKVVVIVSFLAAVVVAALSLVYLFLHALVTATAYTLLWTGVTIGSFGLVVGLIVLGTTLDKRKAEKLNKVLNGETESSLAAAKYSSWRNKVCVPLEFKQ